MDNENKYNNNNYYEEENLNEENLKILEKELDDYLKDDELLYNNEEHKQMDISDDNKEENEETLISLNNQIETLKNLLNDKRDEIHKINNEKNNLKLSLLQIQEEMVSKNQEYQIQISQMEEKANNAILSKEDSEKENKDLNEKLNILKNNKDSKQMNEEFKSVISKLKSKMEENELNINKFIIENTNLRKENEYLKEKYENEVNTLKKNHKKEIENYQKEINNLNLKLNDIFNDLSHNIYNKNKKNNLQLENKIHYYEKEINIFNTEQYNLESIIQKYKKENEEQKSIIQLKDKKLEKLELDYQDTMNTLNDLKNKIVFLEQNEEERDEKKKEKNITLNNLINENEKLKSQNNELKAYYQKINQDITEANIIYIQKKNEFYQQNLKKENKLKEYREKIKSLKRTIDQLSNNEKSTNSRYNTFNNNIYSHRNINSPFKYFSKTLSTRKLKNNLKKNSNYSLNYELNDDYSYIDFINKGRITKGRIINDDFI